jgi:hypothetical protein
MFYVIKMSHYNLQPFVTCLVQHLISTIVPTFVGDLKTNQVGLQNNQW